MLLLLLMMMMMMVMMIWSGTRFHNDCSHTLGHHFLCFRLLDDEGDKSQKMFMRM